MQVEKEVDDLSKQKARGGIKKEQQEVLSLCEKIVALLDAGKDVRFGVSVDLRMRCMACVLSMTITENVMQGCVLQGQ